MSIHVTFKKFHTFSLLSHNNEILNRFSANQNLTSSSVLILTIWHPLPLFFFSYILSLPNCLCFTTNTPPIYCVLNDYIFTHLLFCLDSLIFLHSANLNPSFKFMCPFSTKCFPGLGHKGSDALHINLWNIIGSLKYKTELLCCSSLFQLAMNSPRSWTDHIWELRILKL